MKRNGEMKWWRNVVEDVGQGGGGEDLVMWENFDWNFR